MEIRTQPQNGGHRQTLSRPKGNMRSSRRYTHTIVDPLFIGVRPGDRVQTLLDGAPEGSTFYFSPGTYRPDNQEGYNPKAGQRLVGRYGAKLSGAKVLTDWTVDGSTWWAPAFLPGAYNGSGTCRADGDNGLCSHKQDVFFNDAMLTRVATLVEVVSGTFFTDYTTNRVYVGDDPNLALVEQAWANHIIKSTNDDIEVSNFFIEKSATNPQEGTVACRGSGWTVTYNDISKSQGAGLEVGPSGVSNSGTTAVGNYIHHNGQIGVVGSGDHHTIEYNEIAFNNTKAYDHGWEAGGLKTGEDSWYDGIVRGNYVHDNVGVGIWQDVAAGTTDVDGNYVTRNISGIMFEISYGTRPAAAGGGGTTRIRRNITIHNIWDEDPGLESSAGIINMGSPDVEVCNNEVYDERSCILGFAQLRDTPIDARGDHVVKNFNVHDNFMDFGTVDPTWTGKTGVWTDQIGQPADDLVSGAFNNRWDRNRYRHTNASEVWFDWAGTNYWQTFAQFQAFGHEANGTFTVGSPLTPPGPPSLTVGPRA